MKEEQDELIKPEKGSIYGDMAADDQDSVYGVDSDNDSLNLKNPMEQLLCGTKTQKKIKKRQRVNSGSLNLNEESHCSESSHTDNSHFKSLGDSTERDSLYVLKRDSGSFHSRGYLFLAVAFGMMAYNSYTGQDKPALTSPHIPTVDVSSKNKFSQMRQPLCADVDLMDDQMQNMNLMSSDVGDSFIPESQLQD